MDSEESQEDSEDSGSNESSLVDGCRLVPPVAGGHQNMSPTQKYDVTMSFEVCRSDGHDGDQAATGELCSGAMGLARNQDEVCRIREQFTSAHVH